MSRNQGAAEGRIKEILLRDAPAENLASGKQPVRDAILDLVGVGQQVDFIDDDAITEPISTRDIPVIDRRLENMSEMAQTAFEPWTGERRCVVDRKEVEHV